MEGRKVGKVEKTKKGKLEKNRNEEKLERVSIDSEKKKKSSSGRWEKLSKMKKNKIID